MHFLPDVWVECETCHGKRYNRETLGVHVSRALDRRRARNADRRRPSSCSRTFRSIRRYLATLCAIGLDYLTLGQPAPTLSGGEAQRVKLAAELARPDTGQDAVHPRRADHRPAFRRHRQAAQGAQQSRRAGEHGRRDRAQSRRDQDGRLDRRHGSRGGRRRGAASSPTERPKMSSRRRKQARETNGRAAGRPLRSYTGEMLAPVLEAGARAEREVFSAAEAEKKREGDIELQQVGREAKMPWQTDGRRWHTVDRVAHNGNPCRWEGAALEKVVDAIEARPGFLPANWNDRSVVEITGEKRTGVWFLHALTGDEWLLTLQFRVPERTFDEENSAGQLDLKSLDDLDELPDLRPFRTRADPQHQRHPGRRSRSRSIGSARSTRPQFDRFLDAGLRRVSGRDQPRETQSGRADAVESAGPQVAPVAQRFPQRQTHPLGTRAVGTAARAARIASGRSRRSIGATSRSSISALRRRRRCGRPFTPSAVTASTCRSTTRRAASRWAALPSLAASGKSRRTAAAATKSAFVSTRRNRSLMPL